MFDQVRKHLFCCLPLFDGGVDHVDAMQERRDWTEYHVQVSSGEIYGLALLKVADMKVFQLFGGLKDSVPQA